MKKSPDKASDTSRRRGDKPGPNMGKQMSSKVILIRRSTRRADIIGGGIGSDDTQVYQLTATVSCPEVPRH